jgi:hypothetical protein
MLSREDILALPAPFDVQEVYRQDDPCVQTIGWRRLRAIYRVKHQVARALMPRTILEIGVRAGYSAAAFLAACPTAHFVGLDADNGSHGGVPGYLDAAATMLLRRCKEAVIELYPWDSGDEAVVRCLRARYRGAFDLAHIDGDHTEQGCARDLATCIELVRPGGYLLVDDYDLLPEVRRAADRFVCSTGCASLYLPSPHGDLLLRLPP